MRIAILAEGFLEWGGGVDFFRGVLAGLVSQVPSEQWRLFLVVPEGVLTHKISSIPHRYKQTIFDLLAGKHPDLTTPLAPIADCIDIVVYENSRPSLVSCLQRIEADVVVPSFFLLGEDFIVPWAGYIYDFQHRHFPEFFAGPSFAQREQEFFARVNQPKAVIAHSRAAKQDAARFFPNHFADIFALPSTPLLSESWFIDPVFPIQEKYHLPDRYFMISNQFWIHKSHDTAFDALALFHQMTGHTDIKIVCTGKQVDDRFPDYFATLQHHVQDRGLQDKILFLGYIPKLDQVQIMKQAIAVLQPTLFEGLPGGGSVCDAVALGKYAIISDISVNREMEEDTVFFFKVKSAEELAKQMLHVLSLPPQHKSQQELMTRTQARIERLGAGLREVVHYLVK